MINGEVNNKMSFEAHDRHIYELFNRSQYFIPRNQRRYVWTKRNWQELWEDVMLIQNGIEATHFIGSIVLYSEKDRENGISHYTIIDGQQRIITLTILLASVAFWLKCYDAEDEFNGIKQYIMARDDSDKDYIMVISEYHISLSRILERIMEISLDNLKQLTIDSFLNAYTIGKKDKNIVAAFKFYLQKIENEIQKSKKKPINYLKILRETIVNKILYVSIIASSEEDACTVFEILNARGSVLEDHELLKNFIMRGIKPKGNIDEAKAIWNEMESNIGSSIGRFVKHYATHKYRNNIQEGISDYKIIQRANKGIPTQDLLYDLQLKSRYYERLVNPSLSGENANCSELEYMVYSFFKKRRHEQIRPILLSLIHQKERNILDIKKYEEIILFLYDFVVCYNIIGQGNSNKITNIVYAMAKELENNYSDGLLQKFVSELNEKLPEKDSFYNAFSLVGWSHHGGFYDDDKDKERVKIVLEVLERHKSAAKNCEKFTIEHILDDQDDTKNGRIGNLIPLEEELNKQCNGKKFKEKLTIYKKSSFQTARNIAERYAIDKGRKFDIDERTHAIARDFYNEVLKFKINSVDSQKKKTKHNKKQKESDFSRKNIGDIVDSKQNGTEKIRKEKNRQMSIFDYIS